MTEQEFYEKVQSEYGSRSVHQAREFFERTLNHLGSTVSPDDLDFITVALQNTYFSTKQYNKRFIPRKYRAGEEGCRTTEAKI